MKRILPLLCAAVLTLSLSGCGQPKECSAEFFAMDTVMRVSAYGNGAAEAVSGISSRVNELEALLSRTRADSEVSALNAAAGERVKTSGDLTALIAAAQEYSAAANGAFDITVAPVVSAWGFTTDTYQVPAQETLDTLLPLVDCQRVLVEQDPDSSDMDDFVTLGSGQSIDLGGIAKGYASDCAEYLLRANGVKSASVYLGGNVYVHGSKPDGTPWRVGVQDPADPNSFIGILSLADSYAITSGGYQRCFKEGGKTYHHIIDPATGYPADSGLVSVTVVAPANRAEEPVPGHGALCDAFSTALFVLGEEQAVTLWHSGTYDFELVLVTEDGRVLVTAGIADRFEQNEESAYRYEIIS